MDVIDYIGLLARDTADDNRHNQQEIFKALKELARKYEVAIVMHKIDDESKP
jgi:replicative DNA helicase